MGGVKPNVNISFGSKNRVVLHYVEILRGSNFSACALKWSSGCSSGKSGLTEFRFIILSKPSYGQDGDVIGQPFMGRRDQRRRCSQSAFGLIIGFGFGFGQVVGSGVDIFSV